MEVKSFIITSHGDPSVGIFPTTWELKNGFFFDDDQDLNQFKEGLHELFMNYVDGKISVETSEEIQSEIEYFERMEKGLGV